MMQTFLRYLVCGAAGGAALCVLLMYGLKVIFANQMLTIVTMTLPGMIGAWVYKNFYAQPDMNLVIKELVDPVKKELNERKERR